MNYNSPPPYGLGNRSREVQELAQGTGELTADPGQRYVSPATGRDLGALHWPSSTLWVTVKCGPSVAKFRELAENILRQEEVITVGKSLVVCSHRRPGQSQPQRVGPGFSNPTDVVAWSYARREQVLR